MPSAPTFVRWFNQVTLGDVPLVGLTKDYNLAISPTWPSAASRFGKRL